jgi:TRAP-type mannitol/chloroaromatic compound transport system substrate-binding protein
VEWKTGDEFILKHGKRKMFVEGENMTEGEIYKVIEHGVVGDGIKWINFYNDNNEVGIITISSMKYIEPVNEGNNITANFNKGDLIIIKDTIGEVALRAWNFDFDTPYQIMNITKKKGSIKLIDNDGSECFIPKEEFIHVEHADEKVQIAKMQEMSLTKEDFEILINFAIDTNDKAYFMELTNRMKMSDSYVF